MRSRFRAYLLCSFFIFSLFVGNGQDTIRYTGPTTFCQGGSLNLTTNPVGTKYQWQLDGNNVATSATYVANKTGVVTVIVDAVTYQSLTITVNPNPVASFTFDNDNTCSGKTINFASSVASGTAPFSYLWNFGDGTTSASQNVAQAFSFIGCGPNFLNNSLSVIDANGCSGAVTNLLNVLPKPDVQIKDQNNPYDPFSNCSNSPTASKPNYTITILNNSPSIGCISSYSIDWGDGATQGNISFPLSHTYTRLGAFNLVVSGIGTNGCSNSKIYVVANQSNPGATFGTIPNTTTGLCAPKGVPLLISDWKDNSPGTIYIINYGDGSADTLLHPLNASSSTDTIIHIYKASSCPIQTFTATLNVINACSNTPYSAGNIQVRINPVASFTFPTSVCLGQSNCTSNTTLLGSTGNTCSNTTIYTWDFGDGTAISSDTSPCHSYNSTGNYTIILTAANPCGTTTFAKQVCVVATPIPTFKLDNTTGCTPVTVNATNTSNTVNSCSPPTYLWAVTYTATNCGTATSPAYAFTNGTNQNSVSPTFLFTNPGTYAITLSITNACGTVTSAARTVTVKRPPTVTLPTFSNGCTATTISSTASVAGCAVSAPTYIWSFTGGNPSSSTSAAPTNITYSSAGTYPITLSVTNECGTTNATQQLVVNQTPDIAKPADQIYCKGSATNAIAFSSSLAGTSFTWTNSNTAIGLAASGTGNVPIFTPTNTTAGNITATITVTPVNTCNGAPTSYTVTVYPTVAAPTVTSPVTYCQNTTAIPLTATVAANSTLNWYTTATGGTPSSTAPTPSTATVGTVNYYVSQSNTGKCEGVRTLIAVTVNATPAITGTFTSPTSCASATGSIILKGLVPSTSYTLNYTYNGTAVTPIAKSSDASGNISILSLVSGVYDNIQVTILTCFSNTVGSFSLVDPSAPTAPTATSASPICSGTTLSLSATTVTNGKYSWSGPNSFTNPSQNPTIATATTAATGTYSVTVTVSGCTSAAGTVNVVVNQTPLNITAKSNTPICSGNALNLTSSTTTGGAVTYAWTGPNGYIDATQNPTVSNTATTNMAGTYKVVATLGSCSDFASTSTVVINPTPAITGTSLSPSNCVSPDGLITLNGLTNNAIYTVNYLFNLFSVTKTLTANSTGVITISNLAAGDYTNVSVTASNCMSNVVGPFLLASATPPTTPIATSNILLCSGGTINLNVLNPVMGTYNWTGPNGFHPSGQNPSITQATTAATGTYNVTVSVNGCISNAGSIAVEVDATPTITASATSPICSGNTLNLTATTTTSGAVTFAWTGPNNYVSIIQNPTLNNATTNLAGIYQVVATLGNCSDSSKTTVVVNATPNITSSSFTNPTTCSSFTGSFSLLGLTSGVNYTVSYLKDGVSFTTNVSAIGTTGVVTVPNLSKGNYTNVIVTSLGCSSNLAGPFTLVDPNPPTIPTASGNTPICTGSPLNLTSNTTTLGVTYNWTGPNGFTSGSKDTAISNTTVATSGNYLVTASVNGCTSAPFTVTIKVVASAVVAKAGQPQQLCNATTTTLTGNNAGNDVGTWTVISPSTAIVAQTNNPTSSISNLPIGTTKIVWTINNAICQPSSDTVQITVLAALTNSISPTSNNICKGQNFTIIGSSPSGGSGTYTYQWQQSTDNILFANISGATNISLNVAPITTTHYRRNVISGACTSSSDTTSITVLASIGNNIIGTSQAVCINTPPTLLTGALPTGGGGTFTYNWEQSIDNGTSWTAITGATNATYQPSALAVPTSYRRNVVTALCGGPQASLSNVISISINPDATALFIPTISSSCAPFSITSSIINLTTNNSVGEYRWYQNGNYISSSQIFPGYVITNAGDTVTIKLVAVSANRCKSDSIQKVFTTIVKLKPAFTQSDSVGCGPLKVTFVNITPNPNNYTYLWNFGTGQTSTLAQPSTITFPPNPTYGDTTYAIKFKSMSQCDTITLTSTVLVKSKPKALFTPDKSTGCSPLAVTFTNTSLGSVTVPYVWDFGDGSALLSSNATTVQHTYNVGQRDTFKVKLMATNNCGNDTLVYAIVVQPNAIHLAFAINGNDRYGCLPHTVRFINNTSGANTFVWDFGDGSALLSSTKGIDTISHTYTSAGNFTTTIKASNNCSDTSAVQLTTTFAKPNISISAYPLTACIGDSIHFSNQSDNGVSNFWQFGDGSSSFNRSPVKAYVLPGNFGVKYIASLIYTNGTVCADSSILNLVIRDTLPGTFQISNTTSSCAPFAVLIKYTSGGSLQTKWDFGDGTTSFGDSVVHIYTLPGVYNLRMYVKENAGGCISMASQQVTIGGVSGSFSYQSGFVCLNSPVNFKGISSNANLYKYIFGDGDSLTTSTTPVLHSFTKPGYYFPSITLMNGFCSLTLKGVDTIKIDMGKPGFLTNAQSVCASTSIQFTDTSYSYFGIKSFNWDFGDGSPTSTLQNPPAHTYTTSGTYNIVLRIIGNSGCTDVTTIPLAVAVHNFPASTIGGDSVACTNQPMALVANVQSIDSIQSRNWTFGNNTTGNGINIKAIYNNIGTYNIRLISRTVFGCTDTAYKTVNVNITPTVFASADVTICKGQSVQISGSGAPKLNWFPTQGLSCAACASSIASPSFTTNYYVVGTNSTGCSAADTVIVNVVQPLVLSTSPNDTICIGSRAQLNATNAYSYVWNPVTGLNNSQISNPIATPNFTTKYRVIGTDASNCFADTAYVVVAVGQYPVVDFGSNGGLVIAGTAIQLTSTITNGPIINYRWTPTQDLSCTTCANPTATINNDITYILQAENEYGCKGSDTISYKVNCASSQVFIANAFSPDGDGVNDILFVQGKGIAIVKYFRIFNRWGQMVFEKNNFNINDSSTGWDGKVNGVLANTDVYVFTAEVLCTAGSTFVYKGNVTLVR